MRADLPEAYTEAADVLAAWQRDYAGPQHAGRETLHAALDSAISALRALRDAPVVTIDGGFVVQYERGTQYAEIAPLVGKRVRIVEDAE